MCDRSFCSRLFCFKGRHFFSVDRISSYIGVYCSLVLCQIVADDSLVPSCDRMFGKLLCEIVVCLVIFADHKKLSDAPAASVLMRLLRLSLDDFPSVNLLSVLRSPFLTGFPDPNDEEENSFQQDFYFLDKACKSMNIISGLAEWKDAFTVLERETEKSRDENDDEKTYDLPAPEKIRRIASSLDAFVRIITPE